MKIFEPHIILTILIFLLMIISGIGLSRKGKPYNMILLNIHKLISLGSIAMLIVTLLYYSNNTAVGKNETVSILVSAILFLTLLITGGLLSIKKEMPKIILLMHRVCPVFLALSAFLSIYFLVG